ncbi:MAG: TIGR00730 family Rossman fold protein [Campylobacterales bacterium]|nr:TIGR00730 family Rossman fold protein [Campylobacterales bacterium]
MKKKIKHHFEEPLFPWQRPKSKKEDPHALERLEKIMSNPSYQLVEENISFLQTDEARMIRLQLDYLKAESKMREHGIKHTIVVFGSTRIMEPETAHKKMKKIEKELQNSPHSKELLIALSKAESMVRKSVYYDEARKFGELVGKSGQGPSDCRVALMTGGGPGIMEAANRGAFDVGAKSIGLNIQLPHEQYPNPYITPDLCFKFHYFGIRKFHFLQRARALVIFPGGFGTMDELFEVLTLVQTKKTEEIPIILVGKEYWTRAIDFDFLVDEGVINENDIKIFGYVDHAVEAWEKILQWYDLRGKPLI